MIKLFRFLLKETRTYMPFLWALAIILIWESTRTRSNLSTQYGEYRSNPIVDSLNPNGSNSEQWVQLKNQQLIDSILTIIQSYYVDEERTSNHELFAALIYGLEEKGIIQTKNQSGGSKQIHVKGSSTFLTAPPESKELSYLETIYWFNEVVTFLESHRDYSANEKANSLAMFEVLNSLLNSLDPHSALLDADDYLELRQGTDGAFGGLGVLVHVKNFVLTVVKPIANSPADLAGIKRGDQILSIDGHATFGKEIEQLIEHMRGDPGSEVEIELLASGDLYPQTVKLRREVISVNSVEVERTFYDSGRLFAHLSIDSFSSRTSLELKMALSQIERKSKKNIDGLILDLRSNPGGLLDQSIQVSDLFLSKGNIVSTKGRYTESEHATPSDDVGNYPIVVLINEDSASASEIVAGALRDSERALVVGRPSFGKGSVQTIFELPEDQALKLTIARYYTPSGTSIQNIGIIPDVWLQPVFEESISYAPFGENRFNSEAFLKHTLTANNGLREARVFSSLKTYFPVEEKLDRDYLKKYENKVAKLALIEMANMQLRGDIALPGQSYINKNQKEKIVRFIEEKTMGDYLKVKELFKKKSVYWNQITQIPRKSKIKVSKAKFNSRSKVKRGETLDIRFTIKNEGNESVDQVSVFVKSGAYQLGTKEFLVGHLGPNETRNITASISIPFFLEATNLDFDLGVSMSGIPVNHYTDFYTTEIVSEEDFKVATQSFKAIEHSGGVAGKVEPGEEFLVTLNILNSSNKDLTDVAVELQNLSGKQVKVLNSKKTIKYFKNGESMAISFQLKGGDFLKSKNVNFGSVISHKLFGVLEAKTISLPTVPTREGLPSAVFRKVGH